MSRPLLYVNYMRRAATLQVIVEDIRNVVIEWQRRMFVPCEHKNVRSSPSFTTALEVVTGEKRPPFNYFCEECGNQVPEPVEDYADRILKNASSGYTPTHAELDKIWNSVFLAGNGWVPPALRNRKDDFSSTAEIDAAIPDLVLDQPTHVLIEEANRKIREAYRRGRKAGSK
jgi:hypothetical protein